jgi:hypothetical protein
MAKQKKASPDSTQTVYTELCAKQSFFKSPELMGMTFSHLQVNLKKNDRDVNTKYRSLLNAALACKDFLDVALDTLWEELDSLVPLLKLLPALQFENKAYVRADVHVFLYDLILSIGP